MKIKFRAWDNFFKQMYYFDFENNIEVRSGHLWIDSLKQKYMLGMDVEIRQGDKKLYGRITGHYEHFMTVQTRHYITSISYVDILIGAVQVK